MELDVVNIDGDHHRITVQGHDVDVDQPVSEGGGDAGPTPTALFVASLAACVMHYAKRGLGRGGGQPHVHCTWEMSHERPARVTSIDIEVRLAADTPPERVAAVSRAVAHCTVHNSIVQAPSITMATIAGEPAQPHAA